MLFFLNKELNLKKLSGNYKKKAQFSSDMHNTQYTQICETWIILKTYKKFQYLQDYTWNL